MRHFWRELEDAKISNYASRVSNRCPHLTLGSYNHLTDRADFIQRLHDFCQGQSAIVLTLPLLSSFAQSGALLLTPQVNRELLNFHQDLHATLAQFDSDRVSFYQPQSWIPHVTLANYLTARDLMAAFGYCEKRLDPLRGRITGVSLLEIFEDKQVVKVCEFDLKA